MTGVLIRRKIRTQTHPEGRLHEDREKTAIYYPRKRASEEAYPTDILISDSNLQNSESKFYRLNHPVCGTSLW